MALGTIEVPIRIFDCLADVQQEGCPIAARVNPSFARLMQPYPAATQYSLDASIGDEGKRADWDDYCKEGENVEVAEEKGCVMLEFGIKC